MNFQTLQRNVESVIENLNSIVLDSAMELKDSIADLNVKQLEEGKRVDDASIIPEYQSQDYAKAKKAIGAKPALGTPDLKLTGDFYHGFYTDRKPDYLYTYSTDSKADKLNSKYPKIFGLTVDSIATLKPDFTQILLIRVKDELQKS